MPEIKNPSDIISDLKGLPRAVLEAHLVLLIMGALGLIMVAIDVLKPDNNFGVTATVVTTIFSLFVIVCAIKLTSGGRFWWYASLACSIIWAVSGVIEILASPDVSAINIKYVTDVVTGVLDLGIALLGIVALYPKTVMKHCHVIKE